MQVQSGEPITDEQSVRLGTRLVVEAYEVNLRKVRQRYAGLGWNPEEQEAYVKEEAAKHAAATYNVRSDYANEVMSTKNKNAPNCTAPSGRSPTTCAAAWTAGTSNNMFWGCFFTASSAKTSPATSMKMSGAAATRF
jgi:hypothetical protein